MPIPVTLRGVDYQLPKRGETDWAAKLNPFLLALANSADSYSLDLVKDFRAPVDGTTDSTGAWLEALSELSNNSRYKMLTVPAFTYCVSGELDLIGGSTKGVHVVGLGGPIYTGPRLKWTGAAGQYMFRGKGVCNSRFDNMDFDGNLLVDFPAAFESNQANGGSGSYYNKFFACSFRNPRGTQTDSGCFGWAAPGTAYQVSEYDFYSCHWYGDAVTSKNAFFQRNNGNAKNLRIFGGSMNFCETLLNVALSSGAYTVHGVFLGGARSAYIKSGPNGHMSIHGCQAEAINFVDEAKFISGTAGSNGCGIDMAGCDVNIQAASDNIVISVGGPIALRGNNFLNSRSGGSVSKIACSAQADPGSVGPGSIDSAGNFYRYSSGYAPFYDQAGNSLLGSDYSAQLEHQVRSFGDYGGDAGALVRLRNTGPFVHSDILASRQHAKAPAYTGRLARSVSRYDYTFSDFQAAALTKDLVLNQPRDGERVCAIYLSVGIAFTGTAGTLKFRVGSTVGGTEFLLESADAGVQSFYGRDPAALGTALTTDLSQGAYVSSGAYNPRIRLTSSSGNLSGLSAGTCSVWVITEQLS